MDALRHLLTEHKVDVALLQEVALPRLDVPGYVEFTATGEGRRGTAILARADLGLTPLLALPSGRACAARIGNTTYISVYAPAGSRYRLQRAAFFAQDLAPMLAVAGPRWVLGGDFNCVLRECDSTGATLKSPELAKLVSSLALVDVWPRVSTGPGHTFATAVITARCAVRWTGVGEHDPAAPRAARRGASTDAS
ncbi:hypothetical protein ONE63_011231 [Megalurothrips usitatus]|uniref:Endonuclease/exonuclease/phosphatase domain-containing protein n=1 Tax=Megalurothrips usitatus TaxID=439358 RepID=A0AAV7X3Z0_9NEOP|nr:hypothetical protein ONE63_011231 [Megalurothrips usitatus]